MGTATQSSSLPKRGPAIWWSNAIFFVGAHILASWGITFWSPPSLLRLPTALLTITLWQIANFGVTIGYHRLYAHRTFKATLPLRVFVALIGSSGLQGSIKWWCLRHRLHHRFTDHPDHDPYSASRGLLFSHMGWIFFKPKYDKLDSIDKRDLDADPVVMWQHKYYIPVALFMGLLTPTIICSLWNDSLGGFIWAGLVARIMTWHSTFLVNSLAHWEGLQPYSDEVSAKGNWLFALLTAGEGNHNFHAFPYDYRAGPGFWDLDPSKWVIALLYRFRLVRSLRRASKEDIKKAKSWMRLKHSYESSSSEDEVDIWHGETWTAQYVMEMLGKQQGYCLLAVDGYVINASPYLSEHPGGAAILRRHAICVNPAAKIADSTAAFRGGFNNHSRFARLKLKELRLAKIASM